MGNKKVIFPVRLTPEFYAEITEFANANFSTTAEFVRTAIFQYMHGPTSEERNLTEAINNSSLAQTINRLTKRFDLLSEYLQTLGPEEASFVDSLSSQFIDTNESKKEKNKYV